MNTVRMIEAIIIYIGLTKMKVILCGINKKLGTAEENTSKFEDINYPKSNTREKKDWKKMYRVWVSHVKYQMPHICVTEVLQDWQETKNNWRNNDPILSKFDRN